MTPQQTFLLNMKARAGLASADELHTLASTWLLVGGNDGGQPLAVPPVAKDMATWTARHANASYIPVKPDPDQ